MGKNSKLRANESLSNIMSNCRVWDVPSVQLAIFKELERIYQGEEMTADAMLPRDNSLKYALEWLDALIVEADSAFNTDVIHIPTAKNELKEICETLQRLSATVLAARPTPQPPEDVVEAMAKASKQAYLDCEDQVKAALTAAAALGYVLVKQDRVLPELPEGWEYEELSFKKSDDPKQHWVCFLNGPFSQDSNGVGPTARAAVLSAISKIDGGNG